MSVPEPELHPVGAAHEEAELDVSIVLPVHNEAGHLEAEIDRIIEAMTESAYSWELIIVDDGSSDDSAEIARGRHTRPKNGWSSSIPKGLLSFHCFIPPFSLLNPSSSGMSGKPSTIWIWS